MNWFVLFSLGVLTVKANAVGFWSGSTAESATPASKLSSIRDQ